jgi:hypothetical protein
MHHHQPRPGGMHPASIGARRQRGASAAFVTPHQPRSIVHVAVYYRKSHRGPCGVREQIGTGTTAGARVHNSQQDAADRCSWNLTWPIYGGQVVAVNAWWTVDASPPGPYTDHHAKKVPPRTGTGLAQRDRKDFLFFTGAQKLREQKEKSNVNLWSWTVRARLNSVSLAGRPGCGHLESGPNATSAYVRLHVAMKPSTGKNVFVYMYRRV